MKPQATVLQCFFKLGSVEACQGFLQNVNERLGILCCCCNYFYRLPCVIVLSYECVVIFLKYISCSEREYLGKKPVHIFTTFEHFLNVLPQEE
jgi:hypothetical protein